MGLGKNILFTCILFSFLFSSCREDSPLVYKIYGFIHDSQSGVPISNVQIELKGKRLSGGTFNSNFQPIAEGVSDETGRYELEFPRELFSELEIEGSKPSYIGFQEILEVNEEKLLQGESFNAEVSPVAYLNLNVKNVSPLDDQDRLTLTYLDSQVENCDCCPANPQIFIGMNVDTSLNCITIGDRLLEYTYLVSKSGNSFSVNESIYLIPFEITEIEINY